MPLASNRKFALRILLSGALDWEQQWRAPCERNILA